MPQKNDKLLTRYRVYENLLRDAGVDPKSHEDTLPDLLSNEMRMIRQFRNFLSHNQAPGFLEPTDKMLAVLEGQINEWVMKQDVVKRHLKSPAAAVCEEKETCATGVAKLTKLKRDKLVVLTKAGTYELCSIYALATMVCTSKASKLSDAPKLKEKPIFVRPDTLMPEIELERVNICTADGTEVGKLLGIVIAP